VRRSPQVKPRVSRASRVAVRVPARPSPQRQPTAGRGRGLSIAQAFAHKERLSSQHRDLSQRGKGSRARRRVLASTPGANAGSGHVRGLSRFDRTKSKAQQRLLFARGYAYAHAAAKRGAGYKALPDRVVPKK
jgi:hypothetical protein